MAPKTDGWAGVVATLGRNVFFEGVSGMLTLLPKAAGARSALRLRFEMRPVDMKAVGKGRAIR